ncbi:MAG TPA: hypothetical protein VKP11_06505, partial [Frankiaceae bacterium]|nr:hypothetical protein [Frankiaceae bacterium]
DVLGIHNVYGGTLPARVWKAFMDAALAGTPVEAFPPPASVGVQASASPTPAPRPTRSPSATPSPRPTPSLTFPPFTTPPVPP